MHSKFSTRSLLIVLTVLIVAACVYLFFSVLRGATAGGQKDTVHRLTVEQKAAILNTLSKTSDQNGATVSVTAEEAAARLHVLENVAQSASDSPAAKQSDAEKASILRSLEPQ